MTARQPAASAVPTTDDGARRDAHGERITQASVAPTRISPKRAGVAQYAASAPNTRPMTGAATTNAAVSAATGHSTEPSRRRARRASSSRTTGHSR